MLTVKVGGMIELRKVEKEFKAKKRKRIVEECKTQEGHDHYMKTSFGPWMASDKAGKQNMSIGPLQTTVAKVGSLGVRVMLKVSAPSSRESSKISMSKLSIALTELAGKVNTALLPLVGRS